MRLVTRQPHCVSHSSQSRVTRRYLVVCAAQSGLTLAVEGVICSLHSTVEVPYISFLSAERADSLRHVATRVLLMAGMGVCARPRRAAAGAALGADPQ